jgi:hypothetical protein
MALRGSYKTGPGMGLSPDGLCVEKAEVRPALRPSPCAGGKKEQRREENGAQ